MTPELRPAAEAIKLTRLWQLFHGDTYPIRVAELAMEWSRQVAPMECIAQVLPQTLPGFEGGLFWLPERSEWVVMYRPHEDVPGRANFTIAHEFGHYVLHRRRQERFNCSEDAILGQGADIERQADEFAAYLLMPIDDFRSQVGTLCVTLDLLEHCARRYDVSLTAATLKWLDFTDMPAILVTAREGMVLWWKASGPAKRAGFANIRSGMEVPAASLAAQPITESSRAQRRAGVEIGPGTWLPDTAVREMLIVSERYDKTFSLLIFDRVGSQHDDEPDEDLLTQPPTF